MHRFDVFLTLNMKLRQKAQYRDNWRTRLKPRHKTATRRKIITVHQKTRETRQFRQIFNLATYGGICKMETLS